MSFYSINDQMKGLTENNQLPSVLRPDAWRQHFYQGLLGLLFACLHNTVHSQLAYSSQPHHQTLYFVTISIHSHVEVVYTISSRVHMFLPASQKKPVVKSDRLRLLGPTNGALDGEVGETESLLKKQGRCFHPNNMGTYGKLRSRLVQK